MNAAQCEANAAADAHLSDAGLPTYSDIRSTLANALAWLSAAGDAGMLGEVAARELAAAEFVLNRSLAIPSLLESDK